MPGNAESINLRYIKLIKINITLNSIANKQRPFKKNWITQLLIRSLTLSVIRK